MRSDIDDDAWAEQLNRDAAELIPEVPVDVGTALHRGRRTRASRQLLHAGGYTVIAGVVALGITTAGSGAAPTVSADRGSSAPTATAASSAAGADCFADEILEGLGLSDVGVAAAMGLSEVLAQHPATPAIAPSDVPPDFDVVEVVECRWQFRLSPADPGAYEEVHLDGDLSTLVAALNLPSMADDGSAPSGDPTSACPLKSATPPQLYLVSSTGEVIRPIWPTGPCGDMRQEALEALTALDEIRTVVYEGHITSYPPGDLELTAQMLADALTGTDAGSATVGVAPDGAALLITGVPDTTTQQRVLEVATQTVGNVPITFG